MIPHIQKKISISLHDAIAMKKETTCCNENVFDELYRTHASAVQNYIFFKSGDKERSRDITQEAFVKLWEHCKKVPPAKAKAFLFKVANNLFLNVVAHQKVVFNFKSSRSNDIDEHSPQFLLEEKEYGERLAAALGSLTEVQRIAFLLSRVEGKKYKEIAVILGISEKAAGKRIHDALESLRNSLEKI